MSLQEHPRVLSLLSASTEIVHRLGCGHLLVGRSHGCDDPPLASTLPVATAPRVDPNATSEAIDAAVRAQSVAGGPVYHIHSDFVAAAKPDIIITQDRCRICAVTPEDVKAAVVGCSAIKMVTIMPVTLDDVLADVVAIAEALGVPERGERLVDVLKQRLGLVTRIVAHSAGTPTVAHVEWLAPLMGSGYWIAECVSTASCEMVHGSKGGHSPVLSDGLKQLASADVLILAPCGFGIERTRAELDSLKWLDSPEWLALPAVRAGRVYVADGNLYFNRSSCGVVETAEMVAEMAWPDLAGLWGHHGKHWVRLAELTAFCARDGAASVTKRIQLADDAVDPKVPKHTNLSAKEEGMVPAAAATDHVSRQVDLLRQGEFAAAFGMNSAANRARLGDAGKFEAVVRGNSSFAALAEAGNPLRCDEAGALPDGNRTVQVKVQAPGFEEELTFAFDVSGAVGVSGYATEGVRIVC